MNTIKIRKYTIAGSIILHLLFLLTYKPLSSIQLFNNNEELANEPEQQDKEIVFEIVETPDDAESEITPDETNLLSDKNSIARDQYLQKDKQIGAPYAEGDFDVKNIENNQPSFENDPGEQYVMNDADPMTNLQQEDDFTAQSYNQPRFSRQALLGKSSQAQQQRQVDRPKYNSDKFNAEEIGGLTFNTYNWNFAPYMLAMKRKVEKNVFPPPAFTHMGLINGETLLRFKVMPNGEVKDLEVLRYKGHKSLMETSVQAIRNSSSFKPLPPDFPENYLEVTASFSYYIRRN
jgi:outer membrane biosynthesis protein TonB